MAIALSVAYTPTPLAAGVQLAIFATRQVSAGLSFQPRGAYKLIAVSAAAAASPANVLAAYTAMYGPLIPGTKIFFRLVPINANGVAGPEMEKQVAVT